MKDALPLLVVLAVAAALLAQYGGWLLQWWRNRFSASWPWAPSVILGGEVHKLPSRRGQNGQNTFRLSISYTYAVGGTYYDGEYTEFFQDEATAQGVLKSLKELPPAVRYKHGKPEVSVMDPYRDAALALGSASSTPS